MMHPQMMAILLLASGGLVAGLSLPLILGWVPPNRWYGVRVVASFQSKTLWYRINHRGGAYLFFWSLVVVLVGCGLLMVPRPLANGVVILAGFSPLVMLIAAWQTSRYAHRVMRDEESHAND